MTFHSFNGRRSPTEPPTKLSALSGSVTRKAAARLTPQQEEQANAER
jgi:hypothetical protein